MLTNLYAKASLYAADLPTPDKNDVDLEGGIFGIITSILAVVGFLLIFFVLFIAIQAFAKGQISKAIGRIVGGGIIIILCFQPNLVNQAVQAGASVVKAVVDTISGTVDSNTPTQNNPTAPAQGEAS